MRSSLFSLLFIGMIVLGKVKAQNYIPLPLQNCYWLTYYRSGFMYQNTLQHCNYKYTYKVMPTGDTLINSTKYVKFYSFLLFGGPAATNMSPPCMPYYPPSDTIKYSYAVRQDTAARKLYLVYPNSTVEKLMFDFTQGVGDTIKSESGAFPYQQPGMPTRFRIIDSVYYRPYSDGQCRKVYKLKPFVNSNGINANREIIEGFGNEIGLVEKQKVSSAPFSGSWYGYEADAGLVINSSALIATISSICLGVGIEGHSAEEDDFSVFPNPANNTIIIEETNVLSEMPCVYTLTGIRLYIKCERQGNSFNLDISGIPPGCYIASIYKGGRRYYKKVFKVYQ